jgi:hypothetical protein
LTPSGGRKVVLGEVARREPELLVAPCRVDDQRLLSASLSVSSVPASLGLDLLELEGVDHDQAASFTKRRARSSGRRYAPCAGAVASRAASGRVRLTATDEDAGRACCRDARAGALLLVELLLRAATAERSLVAWVPARREAS